MPDYQKSKIYAIKSYQTEMIYIGSTTQILSKRLGEHRTNYKKNVAISSKKILKYEDYYIELIENFPCNTKEELLKREGFHIRENINICVNHEIAGRTKQEYIQDNIEKIKQYRQDNVEKIKETKKQYYQNNVEKIKQYRQDNIDKLKQYDKQYRQDNAEKYKQYDKQYRQDNAEKYKQYYQDNKERIKQYRQNNKEQIKEYSKQYRQNNKEQIKEYSKQYILKQKQKQISTKEPKTEELIITIK